MDVTESDLPGVGKKHEIPLGDGTYLVIITHNTGKREVYTKAGEDADSEKVLELTDRQSRMVGTILEGAYFQPVESEQVETLLSDDTLLEWYAVDAESPLAGQSLEEADVGRRTGVTVVAIQREGEVISGPSPSETIQAGDTLVVIGDRESCEAFEDLVAGNA